MADRPMQLALDVPDGYGEVEIPPSTAGLTPAQSAVLKHVAEHGQIRSFEAGVILYECTAAAHAALATGDVALQNYLASRRPYAATDGYEICRRLASRGLLEHWRRGVWRRPGAVLGRDVDTAAAA